MKEDESIPGVFVRVTTNNTKWIIKEMIGKSENNAEEIIEAVVGYFNGKILTGGTLINMAEVLELELKHQGFQFNSSMRDIIVCRHEDGFIVQVQWWDKGIFKRLGIKYPREPKEDGQ